ncbi:potassium-transporting ATPase subunit B, partial [Enterovirga sp. CN4-39]
MSHLTQSSVFSPAILGPAVAASFRKLDPRAMAKNPVMFVVEVVAALTTVLFVRDVVTGAADLLFTGQIVLWLWFTVLFANFSEAVAEGRGKAQADSLRRTRTDVVARHLYDPTRRELFQRVPAVELQPGDVVVVEAGDIIPSDGEVIEGIASVNESAITGESAPVSRESGGDRSAGTGG